MRTENVHTLILDAGPSGLAAGYTLARAGHKPVVVDRDSVPGGLMRSIRHGDFVVDVGRKELYNRLARVDEFWTSLIGPDYRAYPHRGAFLYHGHLLEISASHRGFRRGMPWPMFLGCVAGFAVSRMNVFAARPRNVEQYFYRSRGRSLTRIASQGFQEKLTGRRWADIALPENFSDHGGSGLFATLSAAARRAFAKGEVNTYNNQWRHPARGTGQICDALAEGIRTAGGTFRLGSKLLEVKADERSVRHVAVETAGETVRYEPQFVISTIPLEALITLMGLPVPEAFARTSGSPARRKTVMLVYLFLNRPPKFPHAWLQVTDQRSRIGRITNYSGFNADMVPPGKGCLCCEYYCFGADPLLDLDPTKLVADTVDFCTQSGLFDRDAFVEERILKLPGADASQNRHNWLSSMRLGLHDAIAPYKNLFYAARTDLDIATLAGLESAAAILSGDRSAFDAHFDPAKIGIRSEKKAFEFKLPVE